MFVCRICMSIIIYAHNYYNHVHCTGQVPLSVSFRLDARPNPGALSLSLCVSLSLSLSLSLPLLLSFVSLNASL